jgi:hypothetical protein
MAASFNLIVAMIGQLVLRWATGWTVGVLEFDSRRGLGIFLFTTASRPALGYQGLFPWGQSGRGVKLTIYLHLVPRSKYAWSYTSTPPIRLHGVVLN